MDRILRGDVPDEDARRVSVKAPLLILPITRCLVQEMVSVPRM